MTYPAFIVLIPLLPLLSFVVLGMFGKKYFNQVAGWIGTISLLGCTVLSLATAYQYFFVEGMINGRYVAVEAMHYTWLQFTPQLSIDMGILLDPISVMMMVIVSFISLMVHLFSLGYMKGEERYATYFSFLSLFSFSMLGLVLSSNIFQIYIFWELVGISSFLLIGFYYNRPSAEAAAKKAFIVTRFADLGFLVGILMLAFYSGTLDFGTMIERLTTAGSPQSVAMGAAGFLGISAISWALALVFMGGAGKSAMFPLHIWLPDAMEGPTPVSALIHAATMVVAGVYLVARIFPVFQINPNALQLVTWTGAVSAVIAAIIACTQTDIKRVLAYSTMSQIGYMMFALGVSGYSGEEGLGFMGSQFHLFTHAFFKSLLFLCAGAVIHVVHSNEIKDMGGLRKTMPLTHICFLIACLSISGIPPFSGFFSKEEILVAAYRSNTVIYFIGLVTAGLTAFYMFRLYFSIFWKKEVQSLVTHGEGSVSMKVPLVILAVCSLFAGFIPFSHFITADGRPMETTISLGSSALPVLVALIGMALASWLYLKETGRAEKIAGSLGSVYRVAKKKFYVDEIYLFITRKVIFNLAGRPAAWFDRTIVDGMMNRIASGTARTASVIRSFQSGRVQSYTLYFFGGVLLLAVIFIYLWN